MVFKNWPIKEMDRRHKTDANDLSNVEFTGQLVTVIKYKLITNYRLTRPLSKPTAENIY